MQLAACMRLCARSRARCVRHAACARVREKPLCSCLSACVGNGYTQAAPSRTKRGCTKFTGYFWNPSKARTPRGTHLSRVLRGYTLGGASRVLGRVLTRVLTGTHEGAQINTHAGTRRGACRGRRSLRTAHCFGSARLQQGENPYFVPLFRNSVFVLLCRKLRTLLCDHCILVAIVGTLNSNCSDWVSDYPYLSSDYPHHYLIIPTLIRFFSYRCSNYRNRYLISAP